MGSGKSLYLVLGPTHILGRSQNPQNPTKDRVHSLPSRHKAARQYETASNEFVYGAQNGGKGASQQL